MEAELGEMEANGRSERPPYAPGKKGRRARLKMREAALWQDWLAWVQLPIHPSSLPWCTGSVSWWKCWILLQAVTPVVLTSSSYFMLQHCLGIAVITSPTIQMYLYLL